MTAPLSPLIKVAGTPLGEEPLSALTSMRVDLGMGLTGRTTMRFVDFGLKISDSPLFQLGKAVSVSASTTELMAGEVTAVSLEQDFGSAPVLVVTVDDRSCRLGVTSQTRTFLNQSISDVVAKMAGEIGLRAGYSGPSDVREYQLQAGSNLDLLNGLCARAGLVWWVAEGKLVVRPLSATGTVTEVELGGLDGLDSFSVRASDAGAASVKVRGWDRDQNSVVEATYSTKRAGESPFVAKASGRASSERGTQAVVLSGQAPLTVKEAETIAETRFTESASAAVVARGRGTVNARIVVGGRVKVTEAGPVTGTYAVSRVEHTYERRGFTTQFTAGPVRPAGLVDLLGPLAPDPGLSVPGVFPAVVTNVADETNSGRVKVKYSTISDTVESAWARLVTLGAGKGRGLVLSPEVGDEVLVAFENGDTRRPVVLGGLFSKTNATPTADGVADNKVKFRRITSRLGHVVELADGAGPAEQHVLLQLNGKKNKIRLGADKLEVVTDQTAITITNGQAKVELAANGDIKMSGNNIELVAKAEIKLTASNKVTVKGTAGVAVQGAQVQVKADATGSIEAGGPLAIKGATVAIN